MPTLRIKKNSHKFMVTCQFFFLPNKNITFLWGFVVFFWITHTYNLMSASSEYELHLPLEKTMELFLKTPHVRFVSLYNVHGIKQFCLSFCEAVLCDPAAK